MANTQNNETKERIYKCAKECFYEKGFSETTFKDISERAGVPSTLITYYFKKKIQIAADIYSEIYINAQDIINKHQKEYNINSHLFRQILVSYIYYDCIFSYENNKRFYMELRKRNVSNYTLTKEVTQKVYASYIREFNLPITNEKLRIILVMNSAARGGFFNYISENNIKLSVSEIVNTVESIVPRLMEIDHKIVDSYLLKAQLIIKEIDYSSLKFLV